MKQIYVSMLAILLGGCSQSNVRTAAPDGLNPSRTTVNMSELADGLAAEVFEALKVTESRCDSAAESDRRTEWRCAGFSYNYTKFISEFESALPAINSEIPLSEKKDWKYFNDENGGIDFYGKGYTHQNMQVMIAFDPSEVGREIFVGVNPQILSIFSAATGQLNSELLPAASEETMAKNKPSNLTGNFNCRDFETQAAAVAFFKERGFSATYDPYALDADNNGIPCESTSRSTASQSSQCPPGESWVAPYKRKNGSTVRGHCRKRR